MITNNRSNIVKFLVSTTLMAPLAAFARADDEKPAAGAEAVTVQLAPINSGASDKLNGYVPIRAELADQKPKTITKLPADVVAPVFGELALSVSPNTHFHVVLDIPKGKPSRLFVDRNGDGDLTNDPPAAWEQTRKAEGKREALHSGNATLDLGTSQQPREVRVFLYCVGEGFDMIYRHPDYATEGKLNVGGKTYSVMMSDPACVGDFSGAGIDPEQSFAVWPRLLIDLDGDRKFKAKGESVAINDPFTIGDGTYKLAKIAKDGTSFKVVPTTVAAVTADAERAPSAIREGKTRRANSIGKPFELAFTDAISGKSIDLQKDLKGQVVVIDFWATWCGPCVAEMPHMKQFYGEYKDKGVTFIGVSMDNPEDRGGLTALKKYVEKEQIPWPQYHIYGKGADGTFARNWGVTSIPTIFVIDADGKLHSTEARGKLQTIIPELLAKRESKASSD